MSDTEKITIEALAYGGDGVGHIGEKVVFVPNTAPGDIAEVTVTEDKGSFFRGTVSSIISPSPDRVEPFCPHAGICGGCQWQHVSYEAQCRWKRTIVEETVKRICGIDSVNVEDCVASPSDRAFRTIARYPSVQAKKGYISGYHERRSKKIVDIESCPIATDRINRVSAVLREYMREQFREVMVKEITIQASKNDDSLLLTISTFPGMELDAVAETLSEQLPEVTGIIHRGEQGQFIARYGDNFRYEQVAGKRFRIEERSFFQINVEQAEQLAALVSEFAGTDNPGLVVDGFGGVGLFSLGVFPPETEIHLYDLSRSAVKDSRFNAREMNYRSFSAHSTDAAGATGAIGYADTLILDPPRSGLGEEAVAASAALDAKKIISISCNPTTLARDLKQFLALGYSIEKIVPIDMFPHSFHIETVSLLTKNED